MSSPDAKDLFLNVWCQAMAASEWAKPGSKDWEAHRVVAIAYWASVWRDCVELAHAFAAYDAMVDATKPSGDEPESWENTQ